MKAAEIISVGTELLLGEIANTDAQYLSECLAELGIDLFYHTVVGDNPGRLTDVLRTAKSRSDLILTTGGLGPTYDDLTKEVICETLGLPLVLHEPSLERMKGFFADMGREMTENNIKQAYLPQGCTVFDNDWGTAPGCAASADGVTIIMLPGPPRECRPMMRQCVMPYLRARSEKALVSSEVHIFGMGESAVEAILHDRMANAQNPTIAPYCKDGEVMLRVTAAAPTEAEARQMLPPVLDELHETLGDLIYGVDVDSLEACVVSALAERHLTLACAESCTGGLVAKRITDVAGSSAVLLGSIVSYANSVKADVLQVPEQLLEQHGAVSRPVAAYMARGAALATGADIAVSLTGIAGPGGGTPEKPVGLVYAGLYLRGAIYVRELHLGGRTRDRAYIRHLAASNALSMILRAVRNLPVDSANAE